MRSRNRRIVAFPAAALLLLTAACSSGDDTSTDPTTDPTAAPTDAPATPPINADLTPYEQFRDGPTACGSDRPAPVEPMAFERPQDEGLDLETPVSVTIETSCGDIVVELEPKIAPLAVNSFVFLARQGFYDGVISHRIMPGFMFQAGDQTAGGGGDPGYRILRDEWPGEGFSYDRGVVAMANAGPSTTGSQFFIMLGPSSLPPNYTVIGRVISGDEVLDNIDAIPVAARPGGEQSLPLEALYIEDILVGTDG